MIPNVSVRSYGGAIGKPIWSPTYPCDAEPDSVEADKRSLEKWGTAEYAQAFAEAEAKRGTSSPMRWGE